LNAEILATIQAIVSKVKPLVPDNRFQTLLRDVEPGENLVETLGAYGRIVSPPHYLVPYSGGDKHPLTGQGYRVEQIAVRLTELGIGTCYIGSLGREDAVRSRFGLPEAARVGAFLVFGHPATSLAGRAVNTGLRRVAGAINKHPPEHIFYCETFDDPTTPSEDLAPLIEAARRAPSAANAQPWRLLWHAGVLYLFIKRDNPRYGKGITAQYRLYDGGICMANVALALDALGLTGNWEPLPDAAAERLRHPPDLQPLAKLQIQSIGTPGRVSDARRQEPTRCTKTH
jgi:nitroreductase